MVQYNYYGYLTDTQKLANLQQSNINPLITIYKKAERHKVLISQPSMSQ